jgi:hypothetical protein
MRKMLWAAAILLALSARVQAQSADCSDGVRYDDGSFESGLGWKNTVSSGSYVMRIDPPFSPARLDSVCLCWSSNEPVAGGTVNFSINVWDGSAGSPGALLGTVAGQQAAGVTTNGHFFRYDLSSAGISVAGPVFIGPSWNPSSQAATPYFLCEDESFATPVQPAYATSTGGTPSTPVFLLDALYSAFGIRANFSDSATCIASDTALCLNQGRFKVEASFLAPGQPQGTAHVVKLTNETGYLWFFDAGNVEAVIKVIDACAFNQKFWVYAGGLTNVQVTLTVTDTKNGTVKVYTNPQGKAFQPILDSSAFATCP